MRLQAIFLFLPLLFLGQISLPQFQAVNNIPRFVTSGLICQYEINRTTSYSGSGATVNDIRGNVNGTLYNNPTYNASAGGYLQMISTNSQYMVTGPFSSTLLSNGTSFSNFVWVYPTANGVIISELGTSAINTNYHYAQLEYFNNYFRFAVWSFGGLSSITANVLSPINRWYYVGVVYNATTSILTAYINGVNVGSISTSRQAPATSYFGIGALEGTNMGGGGYGNFRIGSYHLYNKALTQNEATLNYNDTLPRYDEKLVMDLSNFASSGSVLTDYSGRGNNANLIGSPTYVSSNGGGYTTSSGRYISTNYNLPSNFTLSIVASLNPSSFWATLWGNESWNAGRGFIAYFSNSFTLNIGSPLSAASFNVSGLNTINLWDFVISGNSITLYKNGISQGTSTFSVGSLSSNGLYFGARHANDGSSFTDICPGTYYNLRVYEKALTASEISAKFSAVRTLYGI